MWRTAILLLTAAALAAPAARADTTEPIRLTYVEGDYAGTTTTTIWSMEFARDGGGTVTRPGGTTRADRITLLPTVNFLIDPILQRLVPKTEFLVADGKPPLLARFTGPRNYAGQMMRLE